MLIQRRVWTSNRSRPSDAGCLPISDATLADSEALVLADSEKAADSDADVLVDLRGALCLLIPNSC